MADSIQTCPIFKHPINIEFDPHQKPMNIYEHIQAYKYTHIYIYIYIYISNNYIYNNINA